MEGGRMCDFSSRVWRRETVSGGLEFRTALREISSDYAGITGFYRMLHLEEWFDVHLTGSRLSAAVIKEISRNSRKIALFFAVLNAFSYLQASISAKHGTAYGISACKVAVGISEQASGLRIKRASLPPQA